MKNLIKMLLGLIVMLSMVACGPETTDHVQYRAEEAGSGRSVVAFVDVSHDIFYVGDTVLINNNGDIVNVKYNPSLRTVKLIHRSPITIKR